jgi:hypothetical protein
MTMMMIMIMIMIKSGRPTHGIGKTLLIGRVGEAQEIARLVFTKIKLILILIPTFHRIGDLDRRSGPVPSASAPSKGRESAAGPDSKGSDESAEVEIDIEI